MRKDIEKWLEEVNQGCREIAEKDESYPDYYIFQSDVRNDADLLIIGENPKGDKTYKQSLIEKNKSVKDIEDLKYNSNQYFDNPNWKISKPIIQMFSNVELKELLQKSTIMNIVYFNSDNGAKTLKKFSDGDEMINFCKEKTKEFIYKIYKPKKILFVGFEAPKLLEIKYDIRKDSERRTEDDKSSLVVKKIINSIPHYIIHHTSQNLKFSSGENLNKKKSFFENEFMLH